MSNERGAERAGVHNPAAADTQVRARERSIQTCGSLKTTLLLYIDRSMYVPYVLCANARLPCSRKSMYCCIREVPSEHYLHTTATCT